MNGKLLVLTCVTIVSCVALSWGQERLEKWPPLDELETMSPEDEVRFVTEWKASFSKGIMNGPGSMMGQLAISPLPDDPLFFRMRYNNPALITCVVETYIAEYQLRFSEYIAAGKDELLWPTTTEQRKEIIQTRLSFYEAAFQRSVSQDGNFIKDAGLEDREAADLGETGLIDYQYFLEDMAASTFSPRVFDYLGTFGGGGEARLEYHARVEPERMLRNIFSATVAVRFGREMYFSKLYRSDTGAPLSVEFILECIDRIAERNPHLGKQYYDEIVDLVKAHGKIFYRVDDPVFSRKQRLLDYQQRVRALNVLRRIATKDDIPTVRWLAEDTQFHSVEEHISYEEWKEATRENRVVREPETITMISEALEKEILQGSD